MSNKMLKSMRESIHAIRKPNYRASHSAVLRFLADSKNEHTGACYPSMQTIADNAFLSERHARKVISELEQDGLLSVTRAGRFSNRYDLHFPTMETENSNPAVSGSQKVSDSRLAVSDSLLTLNSNSEIKSEGDAGLISINSDVPSCGASSSEKTKANQSGVPVQSHKTETETGVPPAVVALYTLLMRLIGPSCPEPSRKDVELLTQAIETYSSGHLHQVLQALKRDKKKFWVKKLKEANFPTSMFCRSLPTIAKQLEDKEANAAQWQEKRRAEKPLTESPLHGPQKVREDESKEPKADTENEWDAPNGNILAYNDLENGSWQLGYDTLNRLTSSQSTNASNVIEFGCYAYDSFGNRLHQTFSNMAPIGAACNLDVANGASSHGMTDLFLDDSSSTAGSNRIAHGGYKNAQGNFVPDISVPQYDASGNMVVMPGDGPYPMTIASGQTASQTFLYNPDGQVCAAVLPGGVVEAYIYDAAGDRVAKGTMQNFTCDPIAGQFSATNMYIHGPNGEEMTELDGDGNWVHTNAYADGELVATYKNDDLGVHFQLSDWLANHRVQADYLGQVESTCTNQPFGEGAPCTGSQDDANDHRFTDNEHDSETNLDHFDARALASALGRWTAPDPGWLSQLDLGNPQSLNEYAYVLNNPLNLFDPDGMQATSGPCPARAATQTDKDGNLIPQDPNPGDCLGANMGNETPPDANTVSQGASTSSPSTGTSTKSTGGTTSTNVVQTPGLAAFSLMNFGALSTSATPEQRSKLVAKIAKARTSTVSRNTNPPRSPIKHPTPKTAFAGALTFPIIPGVVGTVPFAVLPNGHFCLGLGGGLGSPGINAGIVSTTSDSIENVLKGGSVSVSAQAGVGGVQRSQNSSGVVEGTSSGTPGVSLTASYSVCF